MLYRFFLNKFLLFILCFIFIVSCDVSKNHKISDKGSLSLNYVDNNIHNKKNILLSDIMDKNIVLFPLNKYNIDDKFFSMLNMHAIYLHSHPHCKIIIEGHTDNRGTIKYNFILGKQRANALKKYLKSKGAYVEQISVISYGKDRPLLQGNTELVYAKNRRAVIIYKK
ncbi:OmpA family protein [Candidatus Purcelliella pentastirinorum]|uniref:OmpA family protein n=1 Tax=Candidatus Purcelliella pentastirinorum TaxID=472834 RepID=UPI002368147B|nr:OmpA family protein [Candidatus Purcelliella pentastirinorum]WDI79037.1 OmpA family protein [Candidatus Purcelliella pentastirinorum]WDR80174.1 OmpA family protein [Candidatus Purcelliella pentastirinorum]